MRCGLEAAGFADTLCSAVLMLLNMSNLQLTVLIICVRNCYITSAISCLNRCWNVPKSAVVTMSVLELLLLSRSFEGFKAFPPVMSLNDAPLQWQMRLGFVATLSQRECFGASVTSACRLVCTVQERSVHAN